MKRMLKSGAAIMAAIFMLSAMSSTTTAADAVSVAAETSSAAVYAASAGATEVAPQSTTKYITKTCYSYKLNSTKSKRVKKMNKGTAITVVSEMKSFYKLDNNTYVLKSKVGEKRINWTETKYKTPLKRYVSKNNTTTYTSALDNAKTAAALGKGTSVTIVAKTNSGFYKLKDGTFIKTTAVVRTKPKADTPTDSSMFKYTIKNDKATITKYTGTDRKIVIPSEINGYPVTDIGPKIEDGALMRSCSEVIIPDSVTHINAGAFAFVSDLISVTIPDSVVSIGEKAFLSTNLKSIYIPASVVNIEPSAFWNCYDLKTATIAADSIGTEAFQSCENLKKVTLTDNVTSIRNDAFSYSGLTEIEIPDSVTTIGDNAFKKCDNLVAAYIPDSVKSIGEGAFDECYDITLYYKGKSYPYVKTNYVCALINNGIEELSVGDPTDISAFEYAFNEHYDMEEDKVVKEAVITKYIGTGISDVVIPSEIEGCPVTALKKAAFKNNNEITSVYVPDSVKSIDYYVFANCVNLLQVRLPESLTQMYSGVFANCSNLIEVIMPEKLTEIPDETFSNCKSLTYIDIPNGVKKIGSSAFQNCESIMEIAVPDSVSEVGTAAFSSNFDLVYFHIPDSVKKYSGSVLFSIHDKLVSVTLPDCITKLDDLAFLGCTRLKSIKMPKNLTSIGNRAFDSCRELTSIDIPDGVTYIGEEAFAKCHKLTSLNIPKSITTIGDKVFSECGRLDEIIFPDSLTQLGKDIFWRCEGFIITYKGKTYNDRNYENLYMDIAKNGNNTIIRRVCRYCGKLISDNDNKGSAKKPICKTCYDDCIACEACGNLIHMDDANYYDDDELNAFCDDCYITE